MEQIKDCKCGKGPPCFMSAYNEIDVIVLTGFLISNIHIQREQLKEFYKIAGYIIRKIIPCISSELC
ncbi:hypothetical protein SLA2020_300040 [Shorea laevis]